ncbi:MAG: DUF5667 domain-containing protein [Candidatus Deferrimicrobiaceae bacterium]
MKNTPEELLDICLEMARRGEDWRAFLLTYPSHSTEVESLVVLALGVGEAAGPPEAPAPGASAALLRMGRELARREEKREETAYRRWGWLWGSGWAKAAIAGIVMLVLGASSVELSARTVPGNFLYPVKILTERVRFALTSDPEERVELRLTFSERRLSEVVKTLKEGKGVDRELISAMLDEARAALSETAQMPESKSSAYRARIVSLEDIQKDRLRSMERWVSPDRRQDVAEAVRMCDDGWGRMREMMCGPGTRGSGRGTGRGMRGIMMMGPRNDWCW